MPEAPGHDVGAADLKILVILGDAEFGGNGFAKRRFFSDKKTHGLPRDWCFRMQHEKVEGAMSELASIVIGGEALSAWNYRMLFLADGIKYSDFFCPFCGVKLTPCLVYSESELSKSPHFAARIEKHRFECDGTPLHNFDTKYAVDKHRHYEKMGMSYPIVFIDRPQIKEKISTPQFVEELSYDAVQKNRMKYASMGTASPRSYVLQSFVEAFNCLKNKYYDEAIKNGFSNNIWKYVNERLSENKIVLKDNTNYEDVFRSPRKINFSTPRIYSYKGIVTCNDVFMIKSLMQGRFNGVDLDFYIIVNNTITDKKILKSHANTLKILAEKVEKEIKWYAYGTPLLCGDHIEIVIDCLDHIYIK